MNEPSNRLKRVPCWAIWANPIVRRYARSRLRPAGLGVWLLLTLLISGFIFFTARSAGIHRIQYDIVDAARLPIMALLVMQGIILFVLGTGQVAGAMTAEADEGVLDYQRLAPMTPLAKVVGYLFGLPIREWILFAATLPFSFWSMWQGQVPLQVAVQLYAVFVVAGVLYHLTGLLAGTVMKNRRWAFLASMGLVFVLYTVMPQAAKFGLVYFKYVTIMPVVEESFPFLIERRAGAVWETYKEIVPSARFFDLDFPQAAFTLLSQAVLIVIMVVMLWRRWRRAESHLLGKIGAVSVFGWIQLVLLGNALPLIDSGDLFPSRELNRRFGRFTARDWSDWSPEPEEALFMIGFYGTVSLMALWVLVLMITPDRDTQIRGWRRARKVGAARLFPLSDAATSLPWVLAMVAMGTVGWNYFAQALLESRWFPGFQLSHFALPAAALVLFVGAVGFQALLEWKGKRTVLLVAIFIGVVPVMIGTIAAVSSNRLPALAPLAVWLIGLSPATWPAYASGLMVPSDNMPLEIARPLPNAFWFWIGVGFLATCWFVAKLLAARREIARRTLQQSVPSAGPPPLEATAALPDLSDGP